MPHPITIAIDGHSSCGKSTLARDLAETLNYLYVDSGAMYRAVTLHFLNNKVDINIGMEVKDALHDIQLTFDDKQHIYLNGTDVSEAIRRPEVSALVSEVAALSPVRRKLVAIQRQLRDERGIVMDGRDIGTVVFPDAELKIFLTANEETRAKRRYEELKAKGIESTLEQVKSNLAHRDHIDSTREDSPLKMASDAILVDNSTLTRKSQLAYVLTLVDKLL